jgi:adenine specific DNA methylase Mod
MGEKERRFYDTLRDLFVGAKVEGKSGFIKMMRFKTDYFNAVFSKFRQDVTEELKEFPEFREELFDKLYSFFRRYFSEGGSIQFAFTPLQENVWERVYTDKDTALFFKTKNLYYVKTDRIWRSMNVDVDGFKFFFDASGVEHRKAYEKKEIIYEFTSVSEDGTINLKALYSERGRVTKINDILKELKRKKVTEEILEKASRIYEKQNEVDYFINKDACSFLKDQFDLWLRQYLMDEESVFSERRLKQLKTLKTVAFKIIDFISQFEDELRKVWEKPKFVLDSHYVITLDKVKEVCGEDFLEKHIVPDILKSEKQKQEWKELLGVEATNKADLIEKEILPSKEWKKLPIDTKNFDEGFQWRLIEKICENHELDKVLDGWLIKSENWQVLNTILPKFREKVQTIYIDPPFNKEQDADYFYNVRYKDSTWITMLENRLNLAKNILKGSGSIFVRCDYNGNMYVRLLMNEIFEGNFGNEIVINRFRRQLGELTRFNVATDNIFYYSKLGTPYFTTVNRKRICSFCGKEMEPRWRPMSSPGLRFPPERVILGRKLLPPKGRHWTFTQKKIEMMEKEGRIRIENAQSYVDLEGSRVNGAPEYLQTEDTPVDSLWTDLKGYVFGSKFPTENPEELLKRVIEVSSKEGDLIMDFFLGSGTTTAVAQKLRRKWIGVEIAEHFHELVLPRMKKVLAGEKSGISKEASWQGSGFFKYYELEQYEQTLDKAVYKESHPLINWSSENIYSRYVFLKDEKMLKAIEIDYENKAVQVDLFKLYPNMDVAETLSNLKGKWIKKLTRDHVEFEDGETFDLKNLDWKLIQPLIWW